MEHSQSNQDSRVEENYVNLSRGGIFYLSSGPMDGPLLIFVHGWPELAISFRHQLPVFGALGFRSIAIDMPGYGRSVQHSESGDYSLEKVNTDLVEFLDALGASKAVWIGHDWGSLVVWGIASHYPDRCKGVASLCVSYRSGELGIDHQISLVDRNIYPEDRFPNGQWDYWRYYLERFTEACDYFDRHVDVIFEALFVRGDPAHANLPAFTSEIFKHSGWFSGRAPEVSGVDTAVLDEVSNRAYVAAFRRTGFFGADSYYLNTYLNRDYTNNSVNGGILDMPVLFVNATRDFVCETEGQWRQAVEMRTKCRDLTAVNVDAGHWIQQEQPTKINAVLAHWLATKARVWPTFPEPTWRDLPTEA